VKYEVPVLTAVKASGDRSFVLLTQSSDTVARFDSEVNFLHS